MPRRFGALVAALIVAGSGCALTDGSTSAGQVTVDVEVPDRIDWRRTIEGVEVAGSGTDPIAAELAILEGALRELPTELLELADVRTIYRVVSDEAARHGEALAFARGPDVYLTNDTFARAGGRLELAHVLAHELTHVAQFRALTETDLDLIQGILDGEVYSVTEFVGSFAQQVGWINDATDEEPRWRIADPGGTTPYGVTSPAEDMADTVARVVMGRGDEVSTSRVRWAEVTLGTTARALADGKPYLPPGATEVAPRTPLYDEEQALRLSPGRVEPRSYALPETSPRASTLAREIQDELGRRGLAGRLGSVDDPDVTRYSGEFTRGDGVRFLVELWDFREAPGYAGPPPQPVVTYVTLY